MSIKDENAQRKMRKLNRGQWVVDGVWAWASMVRRWPLPLKVHWGDACG